LVNLSNSEEIIEKVETFDYLKFAKMHSESGELYNLSKFNINYIDREYIDFLKEKVNRESKKFHLWLGYHYYVYYTFNASEELKIYFSYNNNTIFNATYENQNPIFIVDFDNPAFVYIPNEPYWFSSIGSWYINFTQVPYVDSQSSTIQLNNNILVKMILYYDHLYGNVGGEFYQIEQYVILNSNLHVIFIYAPATQMVVA
jgi:hypothetical protein